MRKSNLFSRIQAAQNLSHAFRQGRVPSDLDLTILGMPSSVKERFKR